jgi:hypothetical protein
VKQSRKIMYTFPPAKLPVLTTLAREFAVFNGWFSSVPGPTLCNRAFAHYGRSFGHVGMEIWYGMLDEGLTSKLYYFDQASSTMEVVNLLQSQPRLFGTYDQFIQDCANGTLPDYSFVEPNYTDHEGAGGFLLRVRPAPRPSRGRGRALHRIDLQRDPPDEAGHVAIRWPACSTQTATGRCRRKKSPPHRPP